MRAVAVMVAVVVAAASSGASSAVPSVRWVVRDLGVTSAYTSGDGSFYASRSIQINELGQIAGTSGSERTRFRAFSWESGRLRYLGTLAGDRDSYVVAINDRGQVVAQSSPSAALGDERAFVWANGRRLRLRAPHGYRITTAVDLDRHGRVVGTAGTGSRRRAVAWTVGGNVTDIGKFPGDEASESAATNDRGDVVGYSGRRTDGFRWQQRAFLWHSGKMRSLGMLPRRSGSFAVDVNAAGEVVGELTNDGGYDGPVIWSGRGARAIRPPAMRTPSVWEPVAINDRGYVLLRGSDEWMLWRKSRVIAHGPGQAVALNARGQVALASGDAPAIWANGAILRLPLLPGDDGGEASDINEHDQVVGQSCSLRDIGGADWRWTCHFVLWTRRA
jgi:probable HAF family extracellular repeat protein